MPDFIALRTINPDVEALYDALQSKAVSENESALIEKILQDLRNEES
jgi:hypothetical protein